MNLLDLPDCMIEQIFEYLSYDEIAKKRLVCRRIDKICQHLLNIGFSKMIRRHNKDLKRIKSLLPRRESERRNHPLARHADILTCIETRISMLSMTYTKYMELNLCCFIPGKVIDEVFKILKLIKTTTKPLRAHEVLQELRDISSMAIEHFDEKIAHLLKKYFVDMNSYQKFSVGSIDQVSPSSSASSSSSLDDGIIGSVPNFVGSQQQQLSRNNLIMPTIKCSEARNNRLMIQKLEQKYNGAIKKLPTHLSLQFNRMVQIQSKQSRQLRENAVLISEMNSQILDLKRRVDEADTKNREIMANIAQITNGESNPGGGGGTVSNSSNNIGVVVNNGPVVVVAGGSNNCISTNICGTIPNSKSSSSKSSSTTERKCSTTTTSPPSAAKTLCNIKPRMSTLMLKRRMIESSTLPSSSLSSPSSSSSIVTTATSPLYKESMSNDCDIIDDFLKNIAKKPKLES